METTLEPLPGGWSGETFVSGAGAERVVVRVYGGRSLGRGPAAPEVDAAVLALVRGLVPVPEVLEVRRADPASGAPGLLVTSWVPGVRGDLVLPDLDEAGQRVVGGALGHLAGVLAGVAQRRSGPFLDGELRLGSFGEEADLAGVVDSHLDRLPAWDAAERAGLVEVADRAAGLLDAVPRRALVHSDLNPKNVLLDPGTLAVTGVVDWEFAHAGHPATDLGNLLRHDRRPAYVEGVLAGYRPRVPVVEGGPDLLDRARAADLVALVDLAVRAGEAPENTAAGAAHDLLRAVARTGDLHATA